MSSLGAQHHIGRAADLSSELQASLLRQVNAAALELPSDIPLKLLSLRETLLWRVADMSSAAVSLCQAGRMMPAAVLARVVMETTAVLHELASMVGRVVDNHRVDNFDARVMKMLLGSRNRQTPQEAISVLNHIDQMNKTCSGLRSWYDALSEIAHPNYAGVMAAYGRVDLENATLHLGPRDWVEGVVGPDLCACLVIARNIRDQIDEKLEEFSRVCHDLEVNIDEDEGA